jgi:hypothetical protein
MSSEPLTVGMGTWNDYSGVFMTVESLRRHNGFTGPIVVIDSYGCEQTEKYCSDEGVEYHRRLDLRGTSRPRDHVFAVASTEYVMCVDSHVMMFGLSDLLSYLPSMGSDLYFGALLLGDRVCTHWTPEWMGLQYGVYSAYPSSEPVRIPLMGLAAFVSRRDSWLGFHPLFQGFGVEESYVAALYHSRGRNLVSLPFWRYVHRFTLSGGAGGYHSTVVQMYKNYLIGQHSLGRPTEHIRTQFRSVLGHEDWLDEVYLQVTSSSGRSDRWAA